ncbi:MAG: type II toxin-antitoxin system VapC family toxin [Methylococcales bacterium]|nr:type II toxin-antitoxin system VapC family toxin [Methylococcales bacterium]
MKILILDTCAIVKFFINEPGSETVRYIANNRTQLGLNLSVSIFARLEFEKILWRKAAYNQITTSKVKSILERANGYFSDVFRIRDTYPIPDFKVGSTMEYEQMIKKHSLSIGQNDRDVWHLMCAHNYLGCFGLTGESLPHIVTSDRDFQKIIEAEGYGVIDPEKVSSQDLLKKWA